MLELISQLWPTSGYWFSKPTLRCWSIRKIFRAPLNTRTATCSRYNTLLKRCCNGLRLQTRRRGRRRRRTRPVEVSRPAVRADDTSRDAGRGLEASALPDARGRGIAADEDRRVGA